MTTHWLTCNKFTIEVETNTAGIIVKTAPIVRKFMGQPLDNLLRWMQELGGFEHVIL